MTHTSITPEMIEAAEEAYMPFGDMGLAIQCALAAAPQPPEAAPVQLPEPVAYLYHDAPTLDDYVANERAGIPLNSSCISVRRVPHCRNETPLYTEQQVRQLLAARGIEEPQ